MHPDDAMGSSADDASETRERVVREVLSRIASAPAPRIVARPPGLVDGIVSWTVPALAAAILIALASSYALVQARDGRSPARVTDALGLTPRMARFVSTGDVDTWGWLTAAERRP